MDLNDFDELGQMLEELCAIDGHSYSEVLVGGYYRALKEHSLTAVRQATLMVLRDATRKRIMPTPAEILALTPRFEPARGGESLEGERWRRRYDVWQRGRFTDEALEVACSLTDRDLDLQPSGEGEEARYLRCQQPWCEALVAWCTDRHDEGRMFCASHQPADHGGHPVRREDKHAILVQSTPAAKSFLRSIDVIGRLMHDIPISAAEQAITDAEAIPIHARAFEQTAEGPGVNPGLFLTTDALVEEVTKDDSTVASLMTDGGWTYDQEDAVWRNGRRVLLDEQVVKFWEQGTLAEVVYRAPARNGAAHAE